jgi:membrane protein
MTLNKQVLFHVTVLRDSITSYFGEDMPASAAALAFYTIFSLPSLLFIVLWTAARFSREVALREVIFSEIGALVGSDGARQLSATLEGLEIQEPTWWATAVGIGVLLFTATTVLVTLHNTLNRIFKVSTVNSVGLGIWKMVWDRFVSFSLVVTIAFILLVSLMVDAMITAFGAAAVQRGGEWATYMVKLDSMLLDLAATTSLFALFFRYLPDIRLAWKEIWHGAFLTAILFTGGKYLIAALIGGSTAADLYEAAGSVLVLMLWIYYASAIFLFGATFTFTRAQGIKTNCQDASAPDTGRPVVTD